MQGGAEGRGELGSARAPKAGSVRRRTITFSSEDSQWPFSNWSKLTADKSSVATTARRLMTSVANMVSVGVTCYGRYHLDNFDSQTVNRGLTPD